MNFFVISDIHGSSTALKKAIDIYKVGNYRKMIICGDLLYHGARNPLPIGYDPKEVISFLNKLKSEIIVVKGNCESDVDGMVLEFPIESYTSQIITENRDIYITHGHKHFSENLNNLNPGTIILSGHTHIPTAEIKDNLYFCNPGSVSLPKGGHKPTYGVLTENRWEVRDLNSGNVNLFVNF